MFEAVLNAIAGKELNATIEFVFINRDRGHSTPTDAFIDLVQANNIPAVVFSSTKFRKQNHNAPWHQLRETFDEEVLNRLRPFKPDVSVMAGYMLFAPEISRRMLVINQHPALPGETIGKWQDAIWDVIQNNGHRHGSMIHIATPHLDRGPVISTCSFSVRGPNFDSLWQDAEQHDIAELRTENHESFPLFDAIRSAGLKRERPLVVETLKSVATGDLEPTVYAEKASTEPIDMTEQVESAITQIHT